VPGRRDQDAPSRAPRQGVKLRGGSRPEPAPDFLQRNIVARFRTGQIQLGRGLGIDDFLLTQFRKKRNSHLHLCVRKGIHQRMKAVAIGGHASIIASRANTHLRGRTSSVPCGVRIHAGDPPRSATGAVGWGVTGVYRDRSTSRCRASRFSGIGLPARVDWRMSTVQASDGQVHAASAAFECFQSP